jgi:putative transposase
MPGPCPPSITLLPRQRAVLEHLERRATSPQRTVRRAQILLATAEGATNTQVAVRLSLDRETVRTWRTRWQGATERLAAAELQADDKTLRTVIEEILLDKSRPGTPAIFTPEQLCQLVAIACESPQDSDRPVARWTPRELADEVCTRGIVESISPRTVGRFLKRSRPTAASVPVLAQS